MRIIYQGEDFDIPSNFSITLNRYNVLLSDVGDQTKTFTLPGSSKNIRLSGYGNRIDSVYKPLQDIYVLVIDGVFCKFCKMSFNTPPSEDLGLNCTLYLSEGEFYSVIGDDKISTINWPVIKSPTYNSQTLSQRVQYLIDRMKTVYLNPGTYSEWKVGLLKTNKTIKEKLPDNSIVEKFLVLNDFQSPLTFETSNERDTISIFRGEATHIYIDNDVEINTTKGYGMTVFLKVQYVLEYLFYNYGYIFDSQNLINNFPNFDEHCFENNVVDSIYSGVLVYRQLLPDLTIKEFLDKIETHYTGKFVVDNLNKKVSFITYADVFGNTTPDLDLTSYATENIKPQKTEFADIVLRRTDSAKNDESDKTNKITYIDLNLHDVVKYNQKHNFKINNVPYLRDIYFDTIECEGVIELNSKIEVDGKIVNSNSETSSRFSIITVSESFSGIQYGQQDWFTLYYNSALPFLKKDNIGNLSTDLEKLNLLFEKYIEFRKNSNIPFSINMNVPDSILNSININAPKLIFGQRVMIEGIEQPLGAAREKNTTQTFFLRTLRSYADR